jgi:hypothetical protein
MQRSDATASLRAYRTHVAGELERLLAEARQLRAELQRVTAALSELDNHRSRGTLDLLRACAVMSPQVDANTALHFITSRGWEPEARNNPLNAVRSALAHLATSGEIERVSRGIYRATAELQQAFDHDDVMASVS